MEDTRIAVLSVIAEHREGAAQLNALISEYAPCIVGRMGIPYQRKGVSVICIVLDAPVAHINALTGKIGQIDGLNAKTLFSKF